jgi:CheY-like chemotaxis protein
MSRVVVVNHSATVRKMIKFVLDSEDLQVLEAGDATEGLAVLARQEKETVSMLFTDLDLPGQGGLELIRQVRCHPEHGQLPIVLLGEAADARLRQGHLAGASVVLTKPLRSQQILAAVRLLADHGS